MDNFERVCLTSDFELLCSDLKVLFGICRKFILDRSSQSCEIAEMLSTMIIEMGWDLLEFQQYECISEDPSNLKSIRALLDSCKNLEGKLKELRNDLLPCESAVIRKRETVE